MWVFLIGGSGDSDKKATVTNPYSFANVTNEAGRNTWTITRNKDANLAVGNLATSNNAFVETLTVQATLLSYDTMRI
jgi:hypothetical protein